MFVLPALLVVLSLLIYPLISTTWYSLTSKTLIKPTYAFRGLGNYASVLGDREFQEAFFTTLRWTFFSLLGQILVGFTAALCLNRVKQKAAKAVYRILLIIPWAFPSIAIALVWKWLLNGIYGFLPKLLVDLGITESLAQFLSSADLVLPTLVAINIWFGAPMIMVNVLAALQTIPADQYEAAQIDGAQPWQSFRHITIPHIKVVVGLLVVLRTIWVFNSFDIIYMMTAGGPSGRSTTMSIFIYNLGWVKKMVGKASAASILLLLFLLLLCGLYFSVINRWEKEG
ncbi:MAG: sugar ABC transporter permease [Christensenellaceae bacterium]|nr:sugar ABC transporter permease [Christensenellaceae bacterium]MEA5066470.1 sugar ABC transporter permease [Eubacteriales bacterium]MEA5067838.1 sugar ABC transporter permease [Christensenellaceae bacterium]